MFEKILVPLDGSPFAERALAPALALAEQGQGQVILLSVSYSNQIMLNDWNGYGYLYLEQFLEISRRQFGDYLQAVTSQHKRPNLTLKTLIKEGDEASAIVDTAVEEEVDLIVMASHGRSGFSRWVLGSVAERVLRTAPCPVLLMREDKPLNHIMITLDGSALSEYALEPGMEVASRLGSHVTLLSVEPLVEVAQEMVLALEQAGVKHEQPTHEDFYERVSRYLQQQADKLPPTLKQAIYIKPKQGPVVEVILDTIESDKVDLVVMSTHGRSGLKRWLYGSVTDKVLHSAPCNLLIMRPPLEAFEP